MKRLLILTIILVMSGVALNAGGFEKKFEMMDSRIHSKMDKFKGNADAQDFLNKKLACIKKAKSIGDLKACKKEFHPKALKKLL
jgi:hypothetical protein